MGGGCCIPSTLLHYNIILVDLIRFCLSEGQYFLQKTPHAFIFVVQQLLKKTPTKISLNIPVLMGCF